MNFLKSENNIAFVFASSLFFAAMPVKASPAPAWPGNFPDPTTWRADDGTWRATSTSLKILKSRDFFTWEDTGRRVFSGGYGSGIRAKWKNIWAPDVFRLGNEYLLYASLITHATNSAIAVYSSGSPDGPFSNGKIVTYSAETGIRDTIDPEVVRDRNTGRLWLFFGSTGKMYRVKLAPDGKSVARYAKYEHVAGLEWNPKKDPGREKVFEGAYLHRRRGWWYLFASKGCYWNHTYGLVVGRSRTLGGTFRDRSGRKMTDGFATPVISSGKGDKIFGPGHCGEITTIGGRDYLPVHAHIEGVNRKQRPMFLVEVSWDRAGWPKAEIHEKPKECR